MTTGQAAAELGISVRRVQALVEAGRITAHKVGRDWWIEPRALEPVRDRRPGNHTGRPRTAWKPPSK